MGYKDVYRRILVLPFIVLFACGACGITGANKSGESTSIPSLPDGFTSDEPADNGMRVLSAPDLTFHESDGNNGYLIPEIQGCSEELLGATFENINEANGNSDYTIKLAQMRLGDCYITSLDVYFITEGGQRIHPVFDHKDGKFIPFVLKGQKNYESDVRLDADSTPGCEKVGRIELIINRYLRVSNFPSEDSNVCLSQAQGHKTMSPFRLVEQSQN